MNAQFEPAVKYVLANEGGYTEDDGGPTNWGIILDILKQDNMDIDKSGEINALDIRKMSIDQAKQVYKDIWWDKYKYGNITSQRIATKIFDMSVNFGPSQGHVNIQRACNIINTLRSTIQLKEDGLLGPKTMGMINNMILDERTEALLIEMCHVAADVYQRIIVKHSDYIIYEKGWMNRAYLIP